MRRALRPAAVDASNPVLDDDDGDGDDEGVQHPQTWVRPRLPSDSPLWPDAFVRERPRRGRRALSLLNTHVTLGVGVQHLNDGFLKLSGDEGKTPYAPRTAR